jgi:hypothetical protein
MAGRSHLEQRRAPDARKFHGVLAEFGALDAVTGRMNLQEALACLRDLLERHAFEPETAGAAVTVLDSATSAACTSMRCGSRASTPITSRRQSIQML